MKPHRSPMKILTNLSWSPSCTDWNVQWPLGLAPTIIYIYWFFSQELRLLDAPAWAKLTKSGYFGGRFLLFPFRMCPWRLSMQGIYNFGLLPIHWAELRLCSLGQLKFHLIVVTDDHFHNPTTRWTTMHCRYQRTIHIVMHSFICEP